MGQIKAYYVSNYQSNLGTIQVNVKKDKFLHEILSNLGYFDTYIE